MQATPATWQMLVDAGPGLDGLKILCGGEALPRPLADALRARRPRSGTSTAPRRPPSGRRSTASDRIAGAVPIGRPIANTRIYILDPQGQPAPIGVAGELCIGGDGVARGYLNRPELTAEKFMADPFAGEPGARLYRTGDLARYRPDGTIEFLGRLDHQVKIRGFRIELGEIEAALAEYPGVRQAVAVVRDGGDRQLVAYVVTERADPGLAGDLRAHLRLRLPDYMVPSTFAVLDALPLTSNGKIDRLRLPPPEPMRPAAAVAPGTPLEQTIVEVWREVLGRADVGVEDNFFDLGGHSLLAVRMLDAIEQVCGQRLPVSTLFADATIRHLVEAIREPGRDGVKLLTPIQTGGTRTPFFFLYGDWAGGGYYCRELARQVGPDQPFYVLHPWGFDGGAVPPTIEAMAEEYLRALRDVRPTGPYLLGGYCVGGLVALEMAQRLRAQGEQVDFLLAIETNPWNVSLRWLRHFSRRLASAGRLRPEAGQRLFLRLQGAIVLGARLLDMCRHPRNMLRKVLRHLRGERSPGTTRCTGSAVSPGNLELRAGTLSGADHPFCSRRVRRPTVRGELAQGDGRDRDIRDAGWPSERGQGARRRHRQAAGGMPGRDRSPGGSPMTLGRFLFAASPTLMILTIVAGLFNGFCSVGVLALINSRLHHSGTFPVALALGFLGLIVGKLMSSALSEVLLVRFAQTSLLTLTDRLCRSVVRTPLRQLERIGIPRILTVLTDDVSTLADAIRALPSLAINGAILVGCGVYLAWLSWGTFLGIVSLMVVGGLTYRVFMARAQQSIRRARDGRDALFGHFRALTDGIKELKLHRGRRDLFFAQDMAMTVAQLRRDNVDATTWYILANSSSNVFFYLLIGLLLFVVPVVGRLPLEAITGYVFACLYLMAPLWALLNSLPVLDRGQVALQKIEECEVSIAADARRRTWRVDRTSRPCGAAWS